MNAGVRCTSLTRIPKPTDVPAVTVNIEDRETLG
jgi:hypothetical protein